MATVDPRFPMPTDIGPAPTGGDPVSRGIGAYLPTFGALAPEPYRSVLQGILGIPASIMEYQDAQEQAAYANKIREQVIPLWSGFQPEVKQSPMWNKMIKTAEGSMVPWAHEAMGAKKAGQMATKQSMDELLSLRGTGDLAGLSDVEFADIKQRFARRASEPYQEQVYGMRERARKEHTDQLLSMYGAKAGSDEAIQAQNWNMAFQRLSGLTQALGIPVSVASMEGMIARADQTLANMQQYMLAQQQMRTQESIASKQARTAVWTGGVSALAGTGSAGIGYMGMENAANILARAPTTTVTWPTGAGTSRTPI